MKNISKEEKFDSLEEVQTTVRECFNRTVKEQERKTMNSYVLITDDTDALVGSKEDLLRALKHMIVRLKEFAPENEIETVVSKAMKIDLNDKKSKVESIIKSIFGEDEDE